MTDTNKQQDNTSQGKAKQDALAAEIGRRISQARNGLGLSQQGVSTRSAMLDADRIGISRATLSLYETGTNKPGAREILLLCEVLSVSPNWLLFGSESPARALQPSTMFLAGNELDISVRLAFAILALAPADRDSIANIVFSLVSSKVGDDQLSAMMVMANMLKKGLLAEMIEAIGEDAAELPMDKLIEKFVELSTNSGFVTNWGTLRPPISEDQIDSGDYTPAPPRDLK